MEYRHALNPAQQKAEHPSRYIGARVAHDVHGTAQMQSVRYKRALQSSQTSLKTRCSRTKWDDVPRNGAKAGIAIHGAYAHQPAPPARLPCYCNCATARLLGVGATASGLAALASKTRPQARLGARLSVHHADPAQPTPCCGTPPTCTASLTSQP